MLEKYTLEAYNLLHNQKKITPSMLCKKFKIDIEFSKKICLQVWKMQNKNARILAKNVDPN